MKLSLVVMLSLGGLWFSEPAQAQITATVVATCGNPPSTYHAGQPKAVTQDTTGKLCDQGGGAGSGASYTAAAAPFSVTAGVNKPASIDTASSAQFFEPVKPGTTTTIDLSLPGGVLGVNGTTIATVANPFPVQNVANASGGSTPSHAIVAANTTSVAIDASPGTLYSVQLFNNSATIAYLKLYDAAQGSTTCGAGTPKKVILIPASTSGAGVVINVGGPAGVAFATAITRCVTTGIADNDATAPAASTYLVEADYK